MKPKKKKEEINLNYCSEGIHEISEDAEPDDCFECEDLDSLADSNDHENDWEDKD